jgi:serine/alanine adding enzyme
MSVESRAASAPVGTMSVVAGPDWDRLVRRLGALDTYTCAAYQSASSLLEPPGTEPVLLHYRDPGGEIALPLLLRGLPGRPDRDATSAYGYGGPVATGEPDLAGFGAALDDWARAHAVVTTFLRLHPLLDNGRLVPPTAELIDAGATVAWDVSPGRDLLGGLHSDHRRSVRKADRAGLELTVVRRPTALAAFRDMYVATMRRLGADAFYDFPDPYWDALVAQDDALTPVLVEGRLEGRLVAGVLCFASEKWLHAHLSAGTDAGRGIGAAARCYLAAAEWAQSHGLRRLHLGGGVGGSSASTLFSFKHRFDPTSRPLTFQVAKIVHDRDRYRELAGTDSTDGFFPAWRRPS